MRITVAQCGDAVRGLAALAKYPVPLALGVRIARTRFALQCQVDRVNEAHQAALAAAATRDDAGQPRVLRTDAGILFDMTPAAQYDVQRALAEQLREVVELDVAPFRASDLPATLNGAPALWPSEIFVALGPLFVE